MLSDGASWRSLVGTAGLGLLVVACVTGQNPASSADAVRSCETLTDARREIVRRLDAAESGREAPNSSGALFALAGLLGGNPANAMTMREGNAKERQRALDELHSNRASLDREIADRQCTVEARARAGALKPLDRPDYDGRYAGNASTESWCTPPTLSLSVQRGHVTGSLIEGAKSAFDVKGQVYEGGDIALLFKRPESSQYTDDFDGRIGSTGLSFSAKLDTSTTACTYRFALVRSAALPTPKAWTSGKWNATAVLVMGNCAGGTLRFDLADDVLTVLQDDGWKVIGKVTPAGTINGSYTKANGREFRVTGNVRTRELEVQNANYTCRWKLASAKPSP